MGDGRHRQSVLLVCDTATHLRTLRRALGRRPDMGFDVVNAAGVDQALTRVEAGHTTCIVLDLGLVTDEPGDVFNRLHASAPHTPIVVLTPDGDDERGLLAVQLGAHSHLGREEWSRPHVISRAIRAATQHTQAELELRTSEVLRAESQAFTRAILDSLETQAVAIDQDGTIIAANESWLHPAGREGGVPTPFVPGTNYLTLCDRAATAGSRELAAAAAGIGAVLQGRSTRFQIDCQFEGTEQWYTLTALPLAGLGGAVISHVDISARRTQELQVAADASHDPLTLLPNRELFLGRLRHATHPGRGQSATAVLCIDLDRFKMLNDSLGHEAGDVVLRSVADRLRAALPPGDTVARLGGDEFIVVCVDVGDGTRARQQAQRLLDAIEVPIDIGGRKVCVHASIGGTMASGGVEDVEGLIREADTAMSRAKTLGRRRVEFQDEGVRRRARERQRVGDELHQALDNGEFTIAYQPIVSLTTGRLMGAEALLRWRRSDGVMVSPAEFIPVAEESGTIAAIGQWVLVNACAEMMALMLPQPRVPALGLSVNLSGAQLAGPALLDDVTRALSTTGWKAADLCLEITETAMTHDLSAAADNLDGLRRLGVRVALDDFGTGYSTLLYAKHFRIDIIKLDKAFVDGLGQHGPDTAIVQSVLALAHSLGAHVIAEGVETATQVAALRSLGCDSTQGYYFSRPLTFERFAALCGDEQRLWQEEAAHLPSRVAS